MLKMRKNAWSEGEKNNTPNYYGKKKKNKFNRISCPLINALRSQKFSHL